MVTTTNERHHLVEAGNPITFRAAFVSFRAQNPMTQLALVVAFGDGGGICVAVVVLG